MELSGLIAQAQVFLLVFARIQAMMMTTPLLSSGSLPGPARAALAMMTTLLVLPGVGPYPVPDTGLAYAMMLIAEVLIGVIIGLIMTIMFASVQLAGQFFSLQMGFGASQVFDPLAQIQIPIMGQFLNILAMYIFVATGGFQRFFMVGVGNSFAALKGTDFVLHQAFFFDLFRDGLSNLFTQAMVIAFPILGTLLLVQVTMGLLARAAPQMNLLMLGFPIAIGVAFLVILMLVPYLVETFEGLFDAGFRQLIQIFEIGGQS